MPSLDTHGTGLSLARVARILRISRPLVLKMARAGDLPCRRGPAGLRVPPEDLQRWVHQRIRDAQLANQGSSG